MAQIATTIEQSKRLLEHGISPESADMSWRNVCLTYEFGHAMEVVTAEPVLYAFNTKSAHSTPAWSLSALWELNRASVAFRIIPDHRQSSEKVIADLVDFICGPNWYMQK